MTKITYIDALNAALTCDLSDEIKARIHEFLTHTLQGVKCGDVATELGISGQKASALLSQMVTAGEVVKRMDKRTALFLLPENDMTDPANS